MDCGVGSPEEIGACIQLAKRWLPVLTDGIGLGAFALIAIMYWPYRMLRKDLTKKEEELSHVKEAKRLAEEAARHAEHRAELAARQEARAEQLAAELTKTLSASENDLTKELAETRHRLADVAQKMGAALQFTAGGTERFWSRPVGERLPGYEHRIVSSIPIIMFANQKGGVGKTTTMTNLAACFASRGERVLTVDLDYQGSHSSLMQLQSGDELHEPESLIDFIFSDELDPNWLKLAIRKAVDGLYYIPAFYNFERVERRVEYRWTLGVTKDDVRYRLARALLSEEIQNRFDRILIDGPPRFTLGFINGFCAATHLYVPTVVDRLSAQAVELFSWQFRELKTTINPHVQWAGIIGTLTSVNTRNSLALPSTAEEAAAASERASQIRLGVTEPLFIRNPVIKRDADLARASEKGIAYLNESAVRPMFDALAAVVEKKAPLRRTRR